MRSKKYEICHSLIFLATVSKLLSSWAGNNRSVPDTKRDS